MRRRRRSRSRKQGDGRFRDKTPLLIVIAVVIAVIAPSAAGAVTGRAGRQASVDVVSDIDGVQGLNVTSELESGSENCLVEVTNHLGQEVTVTVALHDDSTQYGTLNVSLPGAVKEGDTVEFALSNGDTQAVKMNVNSGTAGNTTNFHVNSSATGIYAETLNRSAPIVSSGNTTCA